MRLTTHHAQSSQDALRFIGEVVAELFWPTRCALCDVSGEVLCQRCRDNLSFLDFWQACPCCGAPFGRVQCDWCNEVILEKMGFKQPPFAACASATVFDEMTGKLVRVFKDQGEQRLVGFLAQAMARTIPPFWDFDGICFIPASQTAFRVRGFDHAELLARELSALLNTPLLFAFERPRGRDQRTLLARERIANVAQSGFKAHASRVKARRLLLIDDVMTSGATLCGATQALLESQADAVYGLTFART